MARKYFVMLEREHDAAPWTPQFGAWDRADVVAEVEDRRDHGTKAKNLLIRWSFKSSKRGIDDLVERENREVAS